MAKINKGVSIFTAELMAILLACVTLTKLPNPPTKAVILSDSKSALQALNRKRNSNREEIISKILNLSHQIISRGTELIMQWLPSHTGIRGNEMADKAAKKATSSGQPVNLKLSPSEAKRKISKAATNLYDNALKEVCQMKGWLYQPTKSRKLLQGLPRKHLNLLTRLRTRCISGKTRKLRCECGEQASFQHIMVPCQHLMEKMKTLYDYQAKHQLLAEDFLLPHQTLGLTPCRILTDAFFAAKIDSWF